VKNKMGMAFRLMIFLLLFNIAVGLLGWAGGAAWSISGSGSATTDASNIDTQFGRSVILPAESSQNFWYRFLDIISLGLFNKIQVILNGTIFSLPALLNSLGIIPSGMQIFINFLITLIYTIGMFELFSGKDLSLR
jgi:hypothetical protein